MSFAPDNQVGDTYVLPTGGRDASRLDVIHEVYGAIEGPGKHLWEKTWTFALQRAVPEGVVTMERGMELIAGMEKHTANSDVWVAVAKMFVGVGKKPLPSPQV